MTEFTPVHAEFFCHNTGRIFEVVRYAIKGRELPFDQYFHFCPECGLDTSASNGHEWLTICLEHKVTGDCPDCLES